MEIEGEKKGKKTTQGLHTQYPLKVVYTPESKTRRQQTKAVDRKVMRERFDPDKMPKSRQSYKPDNRNHKGYGNRLKRGNKNEVKIAKVSTYTARTPSANQDCH